LTIFDIVHVVVLITEYIDVKWTTLKFKMDVWVGCEDTKWAELVQGRGKWWTPWLW